ncbi:MAG: hypothetical protein IT279_02520 [Ignavibacteriaceae bacterium]|nr:hypothetical protein [Ignavibacteriaceae bacterium]
MKFTKILFLLMVLSSFLFASPSTLIGGSSSSDTLFFNSVPFEGKHYKVSIVFLNEKMIEMKTDLRDSSGVTLQSRSVKAKLYPIRENESVPVLFDADIFTAGYHCPVMIYIERLSRMQIYIDDAGCFAGEEIVPSMFGAMMREN